MLDKRLENSFSDAKIKLDRHCSCGFGLVKTKTPGSEKKSDGKYIVAHVEITFLVWRQKKREKRNDLSTVYYRHGMEVLFGALRI